MTLAQQDGARGAVRCRIARWEVVLYSKKSGGKQQLSVCQREHPCQPVRRSYHKGPATAVLCTIYFADPSICLRQSSSRFLFHRPHETAGLTIPGDVEQMRFSAYKNCLATNMATFQRSNFQSRRSRRTAQQERSYCPSNPDQAIEARQAH